MSDFEQTIKNLLHKIPGYTGYEAREQRRDADERLRAELARQYRAEREALTRLGQQAVSSGRLDVTERLKRISQTLDRFIGRLETALTGYAGWFEHVTIDVPDLEQIYQFDAKLADSVPLLQEHIGHVSTQMSEGEGIDEALTALRNFVDNLNTQFDARQEFLVRGKRPAWQEPPQM
jgi:hypothetical protein